MNIVTFKLGTLLQILVNFALVAYSRLQLLRSCELPIKHRINLVKINYLKEVSDQWKYPVSKDISSFLSNITEGANCFVVLDNFQKVNLETQIPIALCNPILVVYIDDGEKHQIYYPIYGVDTYHFDNVSVSEESQNFFCPLSKYFVGLEPFMDTWAGLTPENIFSLLNLVHGAHASILASTLPSTTKSWRLELPSNLPSETWKYASSSCHPNTHSIDSISQYCHNPEAMHL